MNARDRANWPDNGKNEFLDAHDSEVFRRLVLLRVVLQNLFQYLDGVLYEHGVFFTGLNLSGEGTKQHQDYQASPMTVVAVPKATDGIQMWQQRSSSEFSRQYDLKTNSKFYACFFFFLGKFTGKCVHTWKLGSKNLST